MFTGFAFIYLLLPNVIIDFDCCNHWNLTFRWAKRRFVYNWFGMDSARKCDNLRVKLCKQYFTDFRLHSHELPITSAERIEY